MPAALMVAVLSTAASADEGMWQPKQMPEIAAQLKARGLQMAPEDLSNLAAKPLNAVISLGGCTASFVSPQGLVISNRSEEHTSELQSLMRISYAVFCLKKK